MQFLYALELSTHLPALLCSQRNGDAMIDDFSTFTICRGFSPHLFEEDSIDCLLSYPCHTIPLSNL